MRAEPQQRERWRQRLRRCWPLLVLWASIPFLAVLYLNGALSQGREVNRDYRLSDQSAYMKYSKNLAQSDFAFVGDRNRMPMFPGLMALFHRDGMPDQQFFEIGKQVGVIVSLLVLVLCYLLFLRAEGHFAAFTATVVAAFTVFVYKGPWFQADVLFYGLNFWLFVEMVQLVQRPSGRTAVVCGIAAGLAHLTKASVLPGVALACVCALAQEIVLRRRESSSEKVMQPAEEPSPARRRIGDFLQPLRNSALFALVFLVVVFPYIHNSKQRYGHYFYNVNSTFYIWYDSWDEVMRGTRAHGDRIGWPTMPSEEIPTLRRYLRTHSMGQIASRFSKGFRELHRMVVNSYGYHRFLVLYAVLAVGLLVLNARQMFPRLLTRRMIVPAVFLALYFGGYVVLYAWYTSLVEGNRFVLGLFLPALFLLVRLMASAQTQQTKWQLPGRLSWLHAVNAIVLCYLVYYLTHAYREQIGTIWGGT